jgi:serine/threonine protein kinase
MTPERWQRISDILEHTWEHNANDRDAFLDQACGDDLELRSQVESLLASDEDIGDFFASSAMELAKVQAAASTGSEVPATPPINDGLEQGPHIPAYRILREIGHGGMGIVYLAERADGQYRRRVAIKIVNVRIAGEDTLRRFRNERQVEAALDDPNIARLLDGGTTDDGMPYLVLEYVEGENIDRWCDARKMTVRDRLKLFQQVCAAAQYAHDKEVIHRDIKPGNILVTANGTAKLLDFGIAKVLNPELLSDAETTLGLGPMTPEYSSPEQLRGCSVGPASDIYSLGVVLYHLLTRQSPYSVQSSDLAQLAPVICQEEPLKPSAAIQRADSATVAEIFGESPAALRRQFADDLDNILLKALRKEPERRYGRCQGVSARHRAQTW